MRRKISPTLFSSFVLAVCIGSAFAQTPPSPITRETLGAAEKLIGLEFPDSQLDMMLGNLRNRERSYEIMRQIPLANSVLPAIQFNPIPVGFKFDTAYRKPKWSPTPRMTCSENLDDLAFCSIGELAALIKSRKITSEELTRMYIARIKKFGPKLECIITLMEDSAMEQARRADRELASGKYRGPLHGIPYGAKDLLATKNAPTTWGAGPYQSQQIDQDAEVIQRLEKAGAVLIAKTTLGELAMGDVWFGGKTRNPWDVTQGSSGSSAGSTSGTAAGLFAFGIGSETLGSIVSPATTCGITGLRPTYGRVSRTGAMTLSWSMDKLGPLCRTVEDCAIVFNAIYGPDGVDPTLIKAPFNYTPKVSLAKLRIGYLKSDFEKPGHNQTNDQATLTTLESLGAKLIPIELPKYPVGNISFLLSVEGAAAFDDLTRSGRDALLVQQKPGDWANSFRASRFVPAVEYLEANRIRWLLIQDMAKLMETVDVYVGPSFAGSNLTLCNLTGHPCVVMPNGFNNDGLPTSITFTGRLFGEATVLAVAKAVQDATDFHKKHPSWLVAGKDVSK